jgi:hypothetical protein
MNETFPKLMPGIKPKIQKAQKTPDRIKPQKEEEEKCHRSSTPN